MQPRFPITFQTVNGLSVARGDFASHGYLPRSAEIPRRREYLPKRPALFTLRQVCELLTPRGSGPREADSYPCRVPRWVSCQTTDDDAPRAVTLSVHFDNVSDASARRVARLLGVRLAPL